MLIPLLYIRNPATPWKRDSLKKQHTYYTLHMINIPYFYHLYCSFHSTLDNKKWRYNQTKFSIASPPTNLINASHTALCVCVHTLDSPFIVIRCCAQIFIFPLMTQYTSKAKASSNWLVLLFFFFCDFLKKYYYIIKSLILAIYSSKSLCVVSPTNLTLVEMLKWR